MSTTMTRWVNTITDSGPLSVLSSTVPALRCERSSVSKFTTGLRRNYSPAQKGQSNVQ